MEHIHELLAKSNSNANLLNESFYIAVNAGFKVNEMTFLVMLEEFVILKDKEKALEYFDMMVNERFQLRQSIEHYNRIFHLFLLTFDADNATKYLNRLIRDRCEQITSNEAKILVDIYHRTGNIEKISIVYDILESKMIPDKNVLNQMMYVYGQSGNLAGVLTYFEKFSRYNIHPTIETINILMNTYLQMGDSVSLESFYHKLPSLNLQPNRKTFTILISSIMYSKDNTKLEYYLSEIEKYEKSINPSYYYIISRLSPHLSEPGTRPTYGTQPAL